MFRSFGKRYTRMHLMWRIIRRVYLCVLHSYCAQTARKKGRKKKRKRGCAADPRRDNLSHKTGVDINTPFIIDEITFQKKNATRVMR